MPFLKNKPLQSLCINSISEHFDKFCSAYRSSDSKVPVRHFEFLQRIYSNAILSKLLETHSLKEEYLEFVINRHLKELDLEQLRQFNFDIVEKLLLDVGDTIEKLTLTNDLSAESLKNIAGYLRNIETLVLSNTFCTDDTLKAIGQSCPLLKSLDLSYCVSVSNEGLKNLCCSDIDGVSKNLVLKNLNVNATGVKDCGIAFSLEHMPSLEILSYENVPRVLSDIHKNDLDENSLAKAKKYNLTVLDFLCPYSSCVAEVLMVCTAVCPHVKSLYISSLKDEEELDLCTKFDKLENVRIIGKSSKIHKMSINSFLEKRGKQLIHLELTTFSVSVKVLAKSCPKLQSLYLKDMTFETSGDWKISPLNSLQSFSLDDAVFIDEPTAKSTTCLLTGSPNLEILRLPRAESFCAEVNTAVLTCSNKIKELDFSSSDVELPFLESILMNISTLEKMNIEYCDHITLIDYETLLETLYTTKSRADIIWTDSASDYSYSDYDDDFFDEYDVYEDSDYGYEACERCVDDYLTDDYMINDYLNEDSLEDI